MRLVILDKVNNFFYKINLELVKYDNVVLFPKKLEKANRILREVGLPPQVFKDMYVKQE
jgi:hypothetical protein